MDQLHETEEGRKNVHRQINYKNGGGIPQNLGDQSEENEQPPKKRLVINKRLQKFIKLECTKDRQPTKMSIKEGKAKWRVIEFKTVDESKDIIPSEAHP